MPMKLGVKTVEAKATAINAMYMSFSSGARDRLNRDCGALLQRWCCVMCQPCGR